MIHPRPWAVPSCGDDARVGVCRPALTLILPSTGRQPRVRRWKQCTSWRVRGCFPRVAGSPRDNEHGFPKVALRKDRSFPALSVYAFLEVDHSPGLSYETRARTGEKE